MGSLPAASLLLAIVFVASCDPFPSFDGLTGNDSAIGPRDGDGGALDGTSAFTVPSPLPDAGLCGAAAFCDEFDRDASDVVGPWDSIAGSVPSGVSVGGGFLHVVVPKGEEGYLRRALGKTKRVRLAFALRVFDVKNRNVNIGALRWEDNGQAREVFLVLCLDDKLLPVVQLYEQANPAGTTNYAAALATASLRKGRWLNVAIDVNQEESLVSFEFDGLRLLNGKTLKILVGNLAPIIIGGTRYVAPTPDGGDAGPAEFDMDDVRVDVVPL